MFGSLRTWIVATVAGLASLCAASATARADMPSPRATVRHVVTVADKQIPLPLGGWIVITSGYDKVPPEGPPGAAAVAEVILVKLAGARVTGFVVVRTNAVPARGDWGLARDCTRTDIHHAAIHDFSPGEGGSCAFVNHVLAGTELAFAPSWRAALRVAAARRWDMPTTWLVAGLRVSDHDDVLDIRYHFDPASIPPAPVASAARQSSAGGGGVLSHVVEYGRSWRDALLPPSPRDPRWDADRWSPTRVQEDPARHAAIRRLAAWAEAMRVPVRLGLDRQLTGFSGAPLPWANTGSSPSVIAALRLSRLEELRRAGALEDEQFARLRALILREDEGEANGEALPWRLSLWKTLSWRALGSSLDMLVSYVFTGSVATAGGITVVGGALNSVAYYGHELAWNLLGRTGLAPPMKLVDFARLGLEG